MPLSFTGPDSFYSADEEAWWAAVDHALKGVPRRKLFGQTDDGSEIAPLYVRRTGTPARALRTAAEGWSVVQRIDIPDPSHANAQILEDLECGASGLELVFSNALTAYGAGIRVADLAGMEILLEGVQPDLIDIRLEAGHGTPEVLALLLALLERRQLDPASVTLSAGFDPFSLMAAQGVAPADLEETSVQVRDLVAAGHDLGSPVRVLKADGQPWHDAGATPAQELALVLASATAYLRMLEGTTLQPEVWADRISMCVVADADQFGSIAKARAIRALWSCVLEGAGLPQSPMALHMNTSHRMLTSRDPWVNLLRNTVAVFAAGIGGADSICVLPHTLAAGLPDGFARRLARNTQSILLEESNLARVTDPAAGSGAIEDRTDKLCSAAWQLFREIEAAGGIFEALRQGLVQKRISQARTELDKKVASRRRSITGVSEYPDLAEKEVSVLPARTESRNVPQEASALDLPTAGEGQRFFALRKLALEGRPLPVSKQVPGVQAIPAIERGRVAEPFEQLRLAADAFEKRTNDAPKVFLASLGSLAQFTARATWTANAFAAGGIRPVGPAVHGSLDELVAAFRESDALLVCIVSSDEVYELEAEKTARALRQAGAGHIYLAGKPGAREASYSEAGIDTFLYAGCDLLALLSEAHARLQAAGPTGPSDLEIQK